MTRVLMGDSAALHRLGLRDIMRDAHVELIEANDYEVVGLLVEALPDVVVLDMDKTDTSVVVDRIVHDFPAGKVVSCSSALPTMRIFSPFHRGEYYTSELDLAHFNIAIQA